jgi:hypothetical protein
VARPHRHPRGEQQWRCRSRRGRRTAPGPCSAAKPATAGAFGPHRAGPARPLSGTFLCRRSIRRCALWIVESPARSPQRRCSSVWSSASVRSGVASTSLRRSASWGSRTGRRCPPYRSGAALPVARTRCISLIAADGLTAKRRAASRIELPCSTARTIRSRRPMEIGAGMATSRLSQPILSNHRRPFHVIGIFSRSPPRQSLNRGGGMPRHLLGCMCRPIAVTAPSRRTTKVQEPPLVDNPQVRMRHALLRDAFGSYGDTRAGGRLQARRLQSAEVEAPCESARMSSEGSPSSGPIASTV